jgi:hypothetical protein
MVINKIYPHVNVTTTALIRNAVEAVDTGATTLLVPFRAKKGLANKAQKILNIGQFVAEYGEEDFAYQGRSVLNALNWLSAGGAVYAIRLVGSDGAKAVGSYVSSDKWVDEADDKLYTFVDGSFNSGTSIASGTSAPSANGTTVPAVGAVWFNETSNTLYTAVTAGTWAGATEEVLPTSDPTIVTFTAKNEGSYYSDVTINMTALSLGGTNYLDVTISVSGNRVAQYFRRSADNFKSSLEASEFFGSVSFVSGKTFADLYAAINSANSKTDSFGLFGGDDGEGTTDELIEDFFSAEITDENDPNLGKVPAYVAIGNKIEFPIDMILDCGLSDSAKTAIKEFTQEGTGDRDDILVIFDELDFSGANSELGISTEIALSSVNHAVYAQKFIVNDITAGKDIYVSPTYFLASLIPSNDAIYGIQWPTAGLTRGVLTGVKSIDESPSEVRKQFFFDNKINYVEKDSRGYRFMSQRTSEDSETALRFINNVRVVNRMVRDLENLGREYLFEFNDSATLNNLRNALTRYVNEWIQNRTLSLGTVEVQKNATSDERVDVTLNIRFTGTIEIISIDIVIE